MEKKLNTQEVQKLRTACGKEYSNVFRAIKLVRDEKHNFHVVYKTFSDEYIYSFCNPFLDTNAADSYRLISEAEAKQIFLHRLSQDNALELFNSVDVPKERVHS
ncbi:hypothetical protein ACFSRY_12480 [Pontibacter locisalis]|uniref:Uncharacterized protein n=1 Tax=Pontibacter locisalis TaxID=1719035 RepID=A0ABW5IPI3_9BACT